MARTALALFALTVLPAMSTAQTDTTRRDTTRVRQPQDSTRARAEARGEIDLAASKPRFDVGLPNYGFSTDQAVELQEALTRVGCDAGAPDGVVGHRTLLGIQCFRKRQNMDDAGIESVLTALGLTYARPPEPVPAPVTPPAPPKRDTTVLPEVIRQDSSFRPDVRARRDSAMRDSVRRDSLRRDSTARRDTTRRP